MPSVPLITAAQFASHNTEDSVYVSLNNRKVYDVTAFIDGHPGGGDLILEYAGKDVTKIMADIVSHDHSEAAYEMLDEDFLVAYLATPEEEKHILSKNKDGLYKASGDSVSNDEVDSEAALFVSTDYDNDYKQHKFLDLNKPLLPQMLFSNFSKEFYLLEVHRPRHYGKGSAPLFGNFLEPLSKTPWYVIPIVWIPADIFVVYCASRGLSPFGTFFYWSLGLGIWTLVEYILHRFLFHIDTYLPDHPLALTVHFLLHGVHHYLPMDGLRLVMPPALLIVLTTPLYHLAHLVFPYYQALGVFAGAFLGYVMYDVTHYSLHHKRLPFFMKGVKKHHLDHHYKNYEVGFGVTSPFWDWVFGTEMTYEKSKKLN